MLDILHNVVDRAVGRTLSFGGFLKVETGRKAGLARVLVPLA